MSYPSTTTQRPKSVENLAQDMLAESKPQLQHPLHIISKRKVYVINRNTYSFLSEVETEEQEGSSGCNGVCPGGCTCESGVCRVQGGCDRRETNEEERETEE